MFPFKGGVFLGPQGLHDGNAFVSVASSPFELSAQAVGLMLQRTDAHAYPESAARHHVQRRQRLRQHKRVEVWQHQDRCAETYVFRNGRHIRQDREAVVVWLVAKAVQNITRVEDVMVHPDRIESELFRLRSDVQHVLWVAQTIVVWNDKSELQCRLLRVTAC